MAKIFNSVVSKHLPPSGQSGAGKSGAGVSIMLNDGALVSILVVNPDSIQEWHDNVWGNRYLEVNRRADLLSEVKRAAQMNVSVNISGSHWLTKMEPHEWTFPQADKDYSLVNDVTGKSHTLRLLSDGSLSVSPECRLLGRIVLVPMQPVVRIAVVDIADGESLTGAMVQIIDSDGAVVEEWESSSEPHAVEGLNTDVEYTLLESYVPDSYTLAPEITFSLNEDYTPSSSGNVTRDGVILIENALTHVEIDVVNIADGESLEGSHIQIIDQDGLVVEEWDSVGEPHRVEGLRVGVEYTLREVLATEGYTLASDTTFNIDEQGLVTYSGSTSETEDGDVLLLVENTLTHIEFDVLDAANGESLEGATVQVLNQDGEYVEEWTSDTEPHIIEGLKTDHQYTLRLDVAPEGYILTDDATFSIGSDGSVVTALPQTDEQFFAFEIQKTRIVIDAVDITNGDPIPGTFISVYEGDEEDSCVEITTDGLEPAVIEGLKTDVEYYLSIGTPNGYIILEQGITLTIDAHGFVTTAATVTEDGVILAELTQGGSFCFNCKNTQGQQVPCSITVSGPVCLDIETQASSSSYKKLPFGTYTIEVLQVPSMYPQDSRNLREYTAVLQNGSYTSPDGLTFNVKTNRVEIIIPVTGVSAEEAL